MKNKLLMPALFVLVALAIALGVSALVTGDDNDMKAMHSSMMEMMSSMDKMMERCEKMMGSGMMGMMGEGMTAEEHASHHK
jgi:hypothetical protein